MNKVIVNRLVIFFVVGLGLALSSSLILYYKVNGFISTGTAEACFRSLENIFFPLIAIITGFYFSAKYRETLVKSSVHTREHFFVSMLIICPISFAPFVLIYFFDTVDSAFKIINTYKMYGQAFCSAAITYYFADLSQSEE